MNTNSTTTLPCDGCNRYLGDVGQPLVVDFQGFRYRVCGYGCANRLLARLSQLYGANGLQSRMSSVRRPT
jgi:hypothetical protein